MAKSKLNFLLLRGWAREVRHWGEFLDHMASQDYCNSTLALDLPGIGTEKNRSSPISINEITKDLRRRFFEKKNKFDGPWIIIGFSLGGMVALEWLSEDPEDFCHGVIINSSARNLSTPLQRFKLKSAIEILKAIVGGNRHDRILKILSMTANLKGHDSQAIKLWAELEQKSPVQAGLALRQLVAATRFQAPKHITVPLLFLTSKSDKMVDYRCSQALADYYHAPIEIHELAGHELTLDDPSWVLLKIQQITATQST